MNKPDGRRPDSHDFLAREIPCPLSKVPKEGIIGVAVAKTLLPYDVCRTTSLIAKRVLIEMPGSAVSQCAEVRIDK